MSETIKLFSQIEQLDVNQLAAALEFNGYVECVGAICSKSIDGEQFLKLTEVQISLWRLPTSQKRRLWSFIQQVRQDPAQFLLRTSNVNTKMTPKVNVSSKPSLNKGLLKDTSPKSSNLLTDKSNNSAKECTSYKTTIEQTKCSSMNFNEKNNSTLTKEESKLLKNKLEQVLKIDSQEISNNSFIHNQKQPRLPPKPTHLKLTAIKQDINKEPDEMLEDYNDGYLTPTKVYPQQNTNELENEVVYPPAISRSNSTSSTTGPFLGKLRKNYTHLEIRPQVIENNYEEQNNKLGKPSAKDRPLPPIPVATTGSKYKQPVIEFTMNSDNEHLAEYTSVPDDNEHFNNIHTGSILKHGICELRKHASVDRPLPPVPVRSDDEHEQLPEYISISEDESFDDKQVTTRNSTSLKRETSPFHRIEPTIPTASNNNDKFFRSKLRVKQPLPNSDEETTDIKTLQNSDLQVNATGHIKNISRFKSISSSSSTKLLKPHAELPKSPKILPKPPASLPKPLSDLPAPPYFLLKPESHLRTSDTDINQPQHRPLPPLPSSESVDEPVESIEDIPYYSDVDFTTEPCYRETDRKGAKLLLTGLDDGVFVIRPSRQEKYICTFSIMHRKKMFNLGIEKDSKGILQFGSVTPDFDQPIFYGVGDIINYYSRHPLHLSGESIILKSILPTNRR